MSTSYFYNHVDENGENETLIKALKAYAEENTIQTYVIDRPLGDKKYSYSYGHALVVLMTNHKILFVDLASDGEEFGEKFEDYKDDFIEDTGVISDKFGYKDIVGRPKKWGKTLVKEVKSNELISDLGGVLEKNLLSESKDKKHCELIISLLTGSINDVVRVGENVPSNVLDQIKQKIVLFDGDQTRFIYKKLRKKRIIIQGLSGTGKTELLLHKLKEIYLDNPDSKIMLTCHNKVLADSLTKRIPDFFNFMKVDQQIRWEERLWCVNAWGSEFKKNSGTYSYICDYYGLSFSRYSYSTSFEKVCQNAIDELKNSKGVEKKGYPFDYILVDESQDFTESFISLCEMVAKETIYVAGDIFQSIFDSSIISEIGPDFLLNKCYRTEPKTLMFAHALGMALFEEKKLRWLDDREWEACGYIVNKQSNHYSLTREPLRRFEDLEGSDFSSIKLINSKNNYKENIEQDIVKLIDEIKSEHPTLDDANDIAVIFVGNDKRMYNIADNLETLIYDKFGWGVNKAYESKQKLENSLFVSNQNNVKGLEFPFVICVSSKISPRRAYRNALYMTLTRSFIKSYLLLSNDTEQHKIDMLNDGLKKIQDYGVLEFTEPPEEEKQTLKTAIEYNEENISFRDRVFKAFDEIGLEPLFREEKYEGVCKMLSGAGEVDDAQIKKVIEASLPSKKLK